MESVISHKTKSSCAIEMFSSDCPNGNSCLRGHDYMEERKQKMLHNCKLH
jgi:hypothetical protein